MAQIPRYSEDPLLQTIWAGFHRALNSHKAGQLSFAEVTEDGVSKIYVSLNNRIIASLPFGTADDMITTLRLIRQKIDDWEVIETFEYEETGEETEFGSIKQRGYHIKFKKPMLGNQEKTNQKLKRFFEDLEDALKIALNRARRQS